MHKKEFLLLLKKENQFGKINKMDETKDILTKYKNIALVGASKDLKKTSSIVMKYLQNNGYKVYPVNPTIRGEKILGEKVYAKVSEIDGQVDIIDVFRPSNEAAEIAKDALTTPTDKRPTAELAPLATLPKPLNVALALSFAEINIL